MKSRAGLKEEIRTLATQKQRALDENLELERELRYAKEAAEAHKRTATALSKELVKVEAKLTDSTREKALAFATGDRVARRDAAVLQRAANYELYLRKGVSVPVYTNDRSDIRSTLAWLFESATEEQADLLATISGQVDDLQAAYKAALKENAERQYREKQLTECAQELVNALVWSAEYAGLPAAEGWSWYDALKKHAPSALEGFYPRDEETTEADVTTSAEAPMTPEAVREAVISIMSRATGTMHLRAEVQLAHEWVTEKDDFQDRLSALAMAEGNRAKAKVIYSLRRGEV